MEETRRRRKERIILLGLVLPGLNNNKSNPLAELSQLTETAGGEVVGAVSQRAAHFNVSTYIGSGKAEEVRSLIAETNADTVITDHDLTPGQVRNLERLLDVKVVDRSELILDIFASHARTKQARLQVELAQLEYMFPRLVGMWKHFERPEGAIGTRGPGETQLETDRRLVRKRMSKLRGEIKDIQERTERQVASRKSAFTASIVGYTNAGKSTLMNALTGADVLVEDKLFATLDTKSVRWEVQKNRFVVLSDTVGFISRLPHHLIASFHATLEETVQADLLMHVADASHPNCEEQVDIVLKVLAELGCKHQPILTVLNKIDAVDDDAHLTLLRDKLPDAVVISAKTGAGLDTLRQAVVDQMAKRFAEITVTADHTDGKLISFMRAHSQLIGEHEFDSHIRFDALIDRQYLGELNRLTSNITISEYRR